MSPPCAAIPPVDFVRVLYTHPRRDATHPGESLWPRNLMIRTGPPPLCYTTAWRGHEEPQEENMAFVRVDQIANRTILYDRQREGDYGVTGVPIRPFLEEKFLASCEACFTELVALLEAKGFGPVGSILTGGIARAGTGASLHHKNRAFDLDGIILPDGNWVADTFPQRPHMYLAIEAVLRRHFGTVLSYDYNAAHEDHFHFDDGTAIGFNTMSKSRVQFVQNVIFFVYHFQIGRDGVWGPETSGLTTRLRRDLGIGGFSSKVNWLDFLSRVASDALDLEAAIPD